MSTYHDVFALVLGAVVSTSASAQTLNSGSDLSRTMIDMSSHNKTFQIDNNLKSTFGIELIFHRASVGVGDTDFELKRRLKEFSQQGYYAGAYHVPYPTHPAAEQAQAFIEAVRKSCSTDQRILLAVDWERICISSKRNGRSNMCLKRGYVPAAMIDDIVTDIMATTHKPVIIYTDRNTIQANRSTITSTMSSSPLWLATYYTKFWRRDSPLPGDSASHALPLDKTQKTAPNLASHIGYIIPLKEDVAPWRDWSFWQFGEGKGPDVTTKISLRAGDKPVDMNFFNGGRADFRNFFNNTSWACDAEDVRSEKASEISSDITTGDTTRVARRGTE